MDNPWKSLKPGILKAISKEVQAHKFYWYVEENNLNPCLRFRIRKETTAIVVIQIINSTSSISWWGSYLKYL